MMAATEMNASRLFVDSVSLHAKFRRDPSAELPELALVTEYSGRWQASGSAPARPGGRDPMLENPTATEPTLALTRDVLDRIEFGDPRLGGYDYHGKPTDGGRINAAVPILLDGRQIGAAKTGVWVCTSDAADPDRSDRMRQFGYALVPYRGNERRIEWAVSIAGSEDEAEPPLDQAVEELLNAAHNKVEFEEALAAELRRLSNAAPKRRRSVSSSKHSGR
jgi:hypothetical protein